MTLETRVGLIDTDDNRFRGHAVFADLAARLRSPADAAALALGTRLPDDDDREAWRIVTVCLLSPDARVWPVKLCRLLSSWGDPVVGFYGAQLVTASRIMGPGATAGCAAAVAAVRAAAPDGDVDLVAAALDAVLARTGGRLQGFGVPFRAEDERWLAMQRFVAGTALAERPHWRLVAPIVAAMARRSPARPNMVLGMSALLLDAGVPPERCGLAAAVCMTPVFGGHAVEAAELDGAALFELPADAVDYRGVPPRARPTPKSEW